MTALSSNPRASNQAVFTCLHCHLFNIHLVLNFKTKKIYLIFKQTGPSLILQRNSSPKVPFRPLIFSKYPFYVGLDGES